MRTTCRDLTSRRLDTPGGTIALPLTRPRWTARRIVGLYAIVCALLAAPFVVAPAPPLIDYPQHLARIYILAHAAENAALMLNYRIRLSPAPYLGMDLVAPLLAKVMPIYDAGRLFLFLCLLQILAGVAAVHAAVHRRFSPWPAVAALFTFNLVLCLGVVNYVFGIGLWLLAFAAWIVLSRGGVVARVVLGSLLCLAVYFSHYMAWAGYGVCVAAYEAGGWWRQARREPKALLVRLAAGAAPFVAPAILFWSVTRGQPGGATVYGTPKDKLVALISPLSFANGGLALIGWAEIGMMAGVAAVIAWMLLPDTRRRLLGSVTVDPSIMAPLWALGLLALAMPRVLGGVNWMDVRLPVVVLWLFIAACDWRGTSRPVARLAAPALVAALAIQVVLISWTWWPIGRHLEAFRAAVSVIPRGAKVIVFGGGATIAPGDAGEDLGLAYWPTLAIIERDVFIPLFYKNPMMTVHAAPALERLDTPTGPPLTAGQMAEGADPVKGPPMLGRWDHAVGVRNYWGGWPNNFDYALEIPFDGPHAPLAHLRKLRAIEGLIVYRVIPLSPTTNRAP